MGGYCYLNNAAIATQYILTTEREKAGGGEGEGEGEGGKEREGERDREGVRVAILDLDYHGGNGTQDIFYHSVTPLFISIHAHPEDEYPYHIGYERERGEGEGEGMTYNFPLKGTVTDEDYLPPFLDALSIIRKYAPNYLVVSFGADTSAADPLGLFCLSTPFYGQMGTLISQLNIPTLVVFEGLSLCLSLSLSFSLSLSLLPLPQIYFLFFRRLRQ